MSQGSDAFLEVAIACREKSPMAPNSPSSEGELIQELRGLAERLNVEPTLSGWSHYMRKVEEEAEADDVVFLLTLNTRAYTYTWKGFKRAQMKQAQEEYLAVEKEKTPGVLAVLVSADSMEAVRAAYPNFYADTREFLYALDRGDTWTGCGNGGG